MKRIGIDFGTTNTTLAYYDEEQGQICGYRFNNESEYISSAIAYHKTKNEYCIAADAQAVRDDDNYYFYEYYKIGFVRSGNEIANTAHGKTYFDLVKDYLHRLIEVYKQDNLLGESLLDVIVLAVPNTFLSNSELSINSKLENYLKTEAHVPLLFSEPACSSAYYSKQIEPEFSGDLIVVDYGGGTLDVSICRITRENKEGNFLPAISIVQQYVMDSDKIISNGAGIAFCIEMVKNLTGLKEDDTDFLPVIYEFDKILSCRETINKGLTEYYANNEDDFADKELTIRLNGQNRQASCSLFNKIFNKINKPTLDEALEKTLGAFLSGELNNKSRTFRVITVGGFSNLLCVNKIIAEKLGTGLGRLRQDKRLGQLTKTDRYLAVAYGAALYASKEVVKSSEISYELSICYYDGKENVVVLIPEGSQENEYTQIYWLNAPFYIMMGKDATIKLQMHSKNGLEPLDILLDISDSCLNDSTIYIGVRVADNKPILCVRNNLTKIVDEFDLSNYVKDFANRRL